MEANDFPDVLRRRYSERKKNLQSIARAACSVVYRRIREIISSSSTRWIAKNV